MARPTLRSAWRSRAETVRTSLRAARDRLHRANGAARAAETLAAAGKPREAVRLVLDIEVMLFEVRTLLDAASLTQRLAHATDDPPT